MKNVNTLCDEMQKPMLPFITRRRNKKKRKEKKNNLYIIYDMDSMWCDIVGFIGNE